MDPITIHNPAVKGFDEQAIISKYLRANSLELSNYLSDINEPHYLFWSKAQYRKPPEGYTEKEAWLTARLLRKMSSTTGPIIAQDGEHFTWNKLGGFDEILHDIDLKTGGKFLVNAANIEDRQKFLSRGIIEEAIASSQLEGASTTRKYAKKMIAENKKPRNKSEWMIFNNYQTMMAIDEDYKERPMSLELLLEMHAQLTKNAMEPGDEGEVGKLRDEGEVIHVVYNDRIAYETPSRKFVDEQLRQFIKYANDNTKFLHPIIKATILHYWVGYLHPFVDGNGRLARSVFYWYLLKNDYWGMAYIPISMVLKRSKKQYTYAYIYSEQDNHDLTYFIDFSLRRIKRALQEFDEYVAGLQEENRLIELKLKNVLMLNDRQKQLVYYLVSDTTNYVSELSHRTMNGVARNTARSDLASLCDKDLLDKIKEGKHVRYYASKKLFKLINKPVKMGQSRPSSNTDKNGNNKRNQARLF